MNKKRAVLIVDDIDLNREILMEQFYNEYEIFEAADGKQAMEIIQAQEDQIEVILLDIIMPDWDGFYVLENMRKLNLLQKIPVIISSVADEFKYEIRAIECGAMDFITKPCDPRIVKLRVQSVLSRMENEKLRIQNQLLHKEKEVDERYRTVLEQTNTAVIEMDANFKNAKYDVRVSKLLRGIYDNRDFITILEEDKVAEPKDIRAIKSFFEISKISYSVKNGIDIQLKSVSGVKQWYRLNLVRSHKTENHTEKYILTINDANNEIEYKNELLYLSEYDKLTGIYNKTSFCKNVEEMIHQNYNIEYMLARFDLEKFRIINDLFGHIEGDKLLKYIAQKVQEYSAGSGVCCHLGSDMFAVCLPHTKKNVEDMLMQSREDVKAYNLEFNVNICFGLYVIKDIKVPVHTMLDRAEIALSSVKGHYINRSAYYNDSLRSKLLEEQEIEAQMDTAIEEEQFKVYLQPKCYVPTGEIIGSEALVRWEHPIKGMITPGKFIPIFEKNGFIMKLDSYVWEHVCQLIRKWLDEGREVLPISVNISRVNIYNPQLVGVLIGLVKKYDIPTNLLELEVTESAYLDMPFHLVDVVDKLRSYGFVVLMDDFGSGYSSLNMLKDIPVDVLKFDLRFLCGNDEKGRGGNILSALVRMAKGLNLPVIAEGVETENQLSFLQSIGCKMAQGYHFYKPMPIEEFERLSMSKGLRMEEKLYFTSEEYNKFLSMDNGFNMIFNTVIGGAGIFEVSENGIEAIRVNEEYRNILGEDYELFYSTDITRCEVVYKEDREKIKRMFQTAKERKGVSVCQFRRIYKNKKKIWISAKARYLYSDAGRDAYYISIMDMNSWHENKDEILEAPFFEREWLYEEKKHCT